MNSNNDPDKKDISLDIMKELFDFGPAFLKKEFLGQYLVLDQISGDLKQGPDEKTKFSPVTIVAFYMAFINNSSVRKIFAPYFLNALEACSQEELNKLIQDTRPVDSEIYREIEKVGRTSKYIEAYICYALVVEDKTQLKLEEVNGAINYLRKYHTHNEHIINKLVNVMKEFVRIDLASSFHGIKADGSIQSYIDFCKALDKVLFFQAHYFKTNEKFCTEIRRFSVTCILNTLDHLASSNININIKPFFERAFEHSCFAPRNKQLGFFSSRVEISTSQTLLERGYNKILKGQQYKQSHKSESSTSSKNTFKK